MHLELCTAIHTFSTKIYNQCSFISGIRLPFALAGCGKTHSGISGRCLVAFIAL